LALWCQIAPEKFNLAKKWQQIVKFFARNLSSKNILDEIAKIVDENRIVNITAGM